MGIYKKGNAVIVTDRIHGNEFASSNYYNMKTIHCYLAEHVTEPNDVTYFKKNTYIGSMVLNRKPTMLDRHNIMSAVKNGSLYYIADEEGNELEYTELVLNKAYVGNITSLELAIYTERITSLVIPEDVKISFVTEYHNKSEILFNIGNMSQELFEEEESYSEIASKESAETDIWHQIMIEDAELGNR